MKKRIIALALVGILCFCGFTALAQTEKAIVTVLSATYTQNPTTGAYITDPGTAILTVTGTI